MPEAVIVSTARSPIGRAGKGSLVSMRPDDLATQMVRAALDKVPALDPRDIDDLMLGCGQPGGEAGFNIARVVAVELGYDFLPGVTVNRYCSSSLQTTRMAFHAIKAGEGQAFISAGVETVSRFPHGTSDGWPDSHNPLFAEAEARIRACWEPYHAALAALIADTRARFGACLLVDCHSMPAHPAFSANPPDMVLGDAHGTACAPRATRIVEEILTGLGYRVRRNDPYAGGYVTRHYGRPREGVHVVQVEIARALYMDEARIERGATFGRFVADMNRLVEGLCRAEWRCLSP